MKHHFFGKDCKFEDLEFRLRELNFDVKYKTIFVNQVHGNEVVVIDDISDIYQKEKDLPKADALVTKIANLPLGIITADCVPVVFCDEIKEIVGIAHAGWKGAKGGVIENVVCEMVNLGCEIHDIKVILGPAIRWDSYEVSEEFYQDFREESDVNEIFFKKSKKEGHFMFDLVGYCVSRIKRLGMDNIADEGFDTYENEDTLFSYRRSCHQGDKNFKGRNISVVCKF